MRHCGVTCFTSKWSIVVHNYSNKTCPKNEDRVLLLGSICCRFSKHIIHCCIVHNKKVPLNSNRQVYSPDRYIHTNVILSIKSVIIDTDTESRLQLVKCHRLLSDSNNGSVISSDLLVQLQLIRPIDREFLLTLLAYTDMQIKTLFLVHTVINCLLLMFILLMWVW